MAPRGDEIIQNFKEIRMVIKSFRIKKGDPAWRNVVTISLKLVQRFWLAPRGHKRASNWKGNRRFRPVVTNPFLKLGVKILASALWSENKCKQERKSWLAPCGHELVSSWISNPGWRTVVKKSARTENKTLAGPLCSKNHVQREEKSWLAHCGHHIIAY